MTRGVVLSLFDVTGVMVAPWSAAGYECICVDLQRSPGSVAAGNVTQVGANILEWSPPPLNYAIVFGFPPCTDLAVSGARWWKEKGLARLGHAITLVARCLEICEESRAPWMIENPIGALSTHWRKPDASFDPCDYAGYLDEPDADAYTKRTNLWIGGGFNVPLYKPVFPMLGSKMHLIPPGDNRANLRSATPAGFARAVFLANQKRVSAVA